MVWHCFSVLLTCVKPTMCVTSHLDGSYLTVYRTRASTLYGVQHWSISVWCTEQHHLHVGCWAYVRPCLPAALSWGPSLL